MLAPDINEILSKIMELKVKFVDLRFTDLKGTQHHFTVPAEQVTENFLKNGRMFDGSSFGGWKGNEDSDMLLLPDASSVFIDPYFDLTTLVIVCKVIEPEVKESYSRDPRSVAIRAEQYLQKTSIADTAYFGPENEFFIFDGIEYHNKPHHLGVRIHSSETLWDSHKENHWLGHQSPIHEGYSPLPPRDKLYDIRSEICHQLEKVGINVEIHHREEASAGQCEIGVAYNSLLKKADEVQIFKYIVKNSTFKSGKTATFMPKPYPGENGSGMHVHISLFKEGKNLFSDKNTNGNHNNHGNYGNLSQTALYFIGGIIHHGKSLNAFTNPSTNSYKRLVPYFEAPIFLAYSAKNRTASIRIPYVSDEESRRIEVRFPDSTANPYLAFSALLMAGLDGIEHQRDPGPALDKNLYDLNLKDVLNLPRVSESLEESLAALESNHDYLLKDEVFNEDLIQTYIALKREEAKRIRETPHPIEFELYYSS